MAEISVIFFDVDGTLVDSRKDIVKAINYTLRRLGLPRKPAREIVSYVGTGVRDLVEKSLRNGKAARVDKAVKIFSAYYTKHSADFSKLYPHVKEILVYLKDKRKFILTNRYKDFADATLRELEIRRYFEDIIGGDDEDCKKPSACVLEKVLSKLKIDRRKAMIVGDMAIDIETGKNSGVKTCWVTYGLGRRKDFPARGKARLKPDYIIDDLIELEGIIN